ncbi:DUF4345 domain-containing protein [Aquimarina rhabdastrellae]
MKKSKVLKIYLILSGLLLSFIGGATLFLPVTMKATAEIDIAGSINAMNDVRAFSALLLAVGIFSILGALIHKLSYSTTIISSLLFLSLGGGRLLSIILDGMPADGLIKATALEFVLGIIGTFLFIKYRENK